MLNKTIVSKLHFSVSQPVEFHQKFISIHFLCKSDSDLKVLDDEEITISSSSSQWLHLVFCYRFYCSFKRHCVPAKLILICSSLHGSDLDYLSIRHQNLITFVIAQVYSI